jgi:uncharacterized protein (DUF1330 family)
MIKHELSWLDLVTSYYNTHADTKGKFITFRDIIFVEFGTYLNKLCELRSLDPTSPDFDTKQKKIKSELSCFALHRLQPGRKGEPIQRHPLMQLDFDYQALTDYDIREVMQAVFSLPFIAFCGLSCSGRGFYCIVRIAEPERLKEYAEHCFKVFESYGIKPDTSKGRNVNDLRYISYDSNMMIREFPGALKIKKFIQPKPIHAPVAYTSNTTGSDGRIITGLRLIESAQVGQRWEAVQKSSFTIGGVGGSLDEIINRIVSNPSFKGLESKYIKCATDCYEAGRKQPLI